MQLPNIANQRGGSTRQLILPNINSSATSPLNSKRGDTTSRNIQDGSPSNSDTSSAKPQMISKKHIPWHLRVRLKNIVKATSPKSQANQTIGKKENEEDDG